VEAIGAVLGSSTSWLVSLGGFSGSTNVSFRVDGMSEVLGSESAVVTLALMVVAAAAPASESSTAASCVGLGSPLVDAMVGKSIYFVSVYKSAQPNSSCNGNNQFGIM
jgi:hypothetical protein